MLLPLMLFDSLLDTPEMLFAALCPDLFDRLFACVFAGVLASFSAGNVDGGVDGGVDVFFIMAIPLILYKYTVFFRAP